MQYKKFSELPLETSPDGGMYAPIVDPTEPSVDDQNKRVLLSSLGTAVSFTQSGAGAVTRTVDSKLKDVVSVKDFGAVGDGVANDSAAFTSALAFSQNVRVPKGNYRLNTNITVPVNYTLITDYGVEFSGPGTIIRNGVVVDYGVTGLGPLRTYNISKQDISTTDSDALSLFEVSKYRVATEGNYNAIVGAVVQTGPSSGFPCGLTGYGKLNHAGNQTFGVFGRVDLRTAGVGTNEFNTFNYNAGPPGVFPPDRSFGIVNTIPVTVTVAAGGTQQSLIGVQLAPEGSEPNSFVCGIYTNPDAVTDFGVLIDSNTTQGPVEGIHVNNKHTNASHSNVVLQTRNAAPNASSTFVKCLNSTGNILFGIRASGQAVFNSASLVQTTVGTPGAASVLPSNPTGYLKVEINGSQKVIPYYEA